MDTREFDHRGVWGDGDSRRGGQLPITAAGLMSNYTITPWTDADVESAANGHADNKSKVRVGSGVDCSIRFVMDTAGVDHAGGLERRQARSAVGDYAITSADSSKLHQYDVDGVLTVTNSALRRWRQCDPGVFRPTPYYATLIGLTNEKHQPATSSHHD